VEFQTYAAVMGISTLVISVLVYMGTTGATYGDSLRDSLFTTVAIMTSTGYTTADFGQWPWVCQGLLMLLMFIGGCGGSTGGGVKVIRYVVAFRTLFAQILRHHTPRAVYQVKLGGRVLEESLQFTVLAYFFAIMVICGVATVLLALLEPEIDLMSSFTAVGTTLNNIGPGLGAVGPTENFGFLRPASKWLLSLCMLMGRLELFSILVFFSVRFWREG
jgi:trk system potassium uptake protein TrkH